MAAIAITVLFLRFLYMFSKRNVVINGFRTNCHASKKQSLFPFSRSVDNFSEFILDRSDVGEVAMLGQKYISVLRCCNSFEVFSNTCLLFVQIETQAHSFSNYCNPNQNI